MKIRIGDGVIWRALSGEILVTNFADDLVFGLEGAGARMWRLMAENGSLEETARIIAAEYDAEPEIIRRDLEALAGELAKKGLIEIVPGKKGRARA